MNVRDLEEFLKNIKNKEAKVVFVDHLNDTAFELDTAQPYFNNEFTVYCDKDTDVYQGIGGGCYYDIIHNEDLVKEGDLGVLSNGGNDKEYIIGLSSEKNKMSIYE